MKKVLLLLNLIIFSIVGYCAPPAVTDGCFLNDGSAFYINATNKQAGSGVNIGYVWNTSLALNTTSSCPRVGTSVGAQTATICYGPAPGSLASRKGLVYTGVSIENCPIDAGVSLLCLMAGGIGFSYIRNKGKLK